MLDARSSGYLAIPNFQAFYHKVMNQYMRPIARLLFANVYGYDTQTFGFSIQYQPTGDTSLQLHTDASAVTMNINLNLPGEDFTGSEVDFVDRHLGKPNVPSLNLAWRLFIEARCRTPHIQLLVANVPIWCFGCMAIICKYHEELGLIVILMPINVGLLRTVSLIISRRFKMSLCV
ncbi:hypothetical protein [Psychrobacter sp. BI730]|uniref:hypothetical protein n=1 Tax=Psychrobacter sp. BI730 TaxID=2705463 RepID=UPI001C538685|nr:hypothetical protein [Psychrobacter sp. BI730]